MSTIDVTNLDELNCKVDNIFAELDSRIKNQQKTIEDQQKEIDELHQINALQDEKLKRKWVVVLTTIEYNRLIPAPENASYNEIYKYPNVVYLVVDFNKPKAVYIGDILIAEAESTGPNGFAYNFPIIF
jgi:hypothetical protein